MTMLAWFIPPLAGLAGWLAWSRLPSDPDGDDDPLECVFAVVLLSVLVTGFAGLLLAELGQLRPWSLAGSLVVLNIYLSRFPRQLRVGPRPSHRDLAAVLLLSILVAAILAPASEDLLGGRDPGVYANTAAWLAREGTLRVRSEVLAALPPEARPIFHRGILFMGFYVTDAAAGEISPQFLHLFPIFMAIGHWLGGASGAFLVPPYLGTLSTLAVFFFTRRLLGLAPALVAAGTLVLNLAQIWGMRNPYSEGATQLGVFAALWCIGRAYQTGGMRWGVLGGASLGLCFLVRIDSPLLLASIAPVLAVLHASASRPQRWATHAFLPLAIVLAAWGAVHGWMFSRAYVRDLGSVLVPLWALTLALVALSVAAFGLPRHTRRIVRWVHDQGTLLWGVAAITLCAAFFVGMWVRPRIEPFQINPNSGDRTYYEETLVRMAWYVSMPGLVLAVGGVLTVLRRWVVRRGVEWLPFLAILLPFALLYFWRPSIHPDHPWAMRRFLPVILPGICVAIAVAASSLWTLDRWWRLGRVAAIVSIGAVVWHEATMSGPFWRFREKNGVVNQLGAVADRVPQHSVLLFNSPGPETLIATPLAFEWARTVLPVFRPGNTVDREALESIFEREVMRWLDQGREVLYLTLSDGDSAFVTPHVRWQLVANMRLSVPTIGSSKIRPPRQPKRYGVHFQLLRAGSVTDSTQPCPASLPLREPLLGIAQGLYAPGGRGGRYRWSMPESRIVFPSCDRTGAAPPRYLRVLASCGRKAAPDACRVEVVLNGTALGDLHLTEGFAEHYLDIPETALSGANTSLDVRFRKSRLPSAAVEAKGGRPERSFRVSDVALVGRLEPD